MLPSRRFAPGKDLANFVKTVWELLEGTKYGKMIINVAVGLFNTKYDGKRDEVMLSHSPPFTIAYKDWIDQQNDPNVEVKITGCDNLDMDWIRTISKSRKMQDTGVINQYVVASGLVRTLQMLKTKWKDGYTLVGLKTDAIYLAIPKNMKMIQYLNIVMILMFGMFIQCTIMKQQSIWASMGTMNNLKHHQIHLI